MSKPKKPTKCQEKIADRFDAGETVAELAWQLSDGREGDYAAKRDKVEEAIRVTMNWRARND
jgi:hypothetical protein